MTNQYLELETLRNLVKGNHSRGAVKDALPFLSKKIHYNRDSWQQMIGELVLLFTNLQTKNIPEPEFEMNYSDLSVFIGNQIKCEPEDAREDLYKFIDEYLFSNHEINLIHPFLFNFIVNKKGKESKNIESKFARYVFEALIEDSSSFKSFFSSEETDDILSRTVIKSLNKITTEKKVNSKPEYTALRPDLTPLIEADLKYLVIKTRFAEDYFPLLVNYYLFFVLCQIVYRFNQTSQKQGLDKETIPFYYTIESESLRSSRNAANGLFSYKAIKEQVKTLFIHSHAQAQLSHNLFNPVKDDGTRDFLTYSMIYDMLDENGISEDEFKQSVDEWIKVYCEEKNMNCPPRSDTLETSFDTLAECLGKKMSPSVVQRYADNLETFAKDSFLKSRGRLGYVFNLSHDLIIALTIVIVKDQRLPLKSYYTELEKRGIQLDYPSKVELVSLLEAHNLLDKKSDSGDAQYVKPIQ